MKADPKAKDGAAPDTTPMKVDLAPPVHTEPSASRSMGDIARNILRGKEEIVSHPGSSQYALGGGASACGLAGMNAARIILEKQLVLKDEPEQLFRWLLKGETTEEIMDICAAWKGSAHLEVDDILGTPFFEDCLQSQHTYGGRPGFTQFQRLLKRMDDVPDQSAAIIITRPPEIITVLKLILSRTVVYVIFDSHPRPNHPDGAGFILNTSLDASAEHLKQLLPVDESLLRDHTLEWSAQLLAQYSGHMITSRGPSSLSESTRTLLLGASLDVLALRSDNSALKDSLADVKRDLVAARRDIGTLREEVTNGRDERRWMYNQHRQELERAKKESCTESRFTLASMIPGWSTSASSSAKVDHGLRNQNEPRGPSHGRLSSHKGASLGVFSNSYAQAASSASTSKPANSESAILKKLKREDEDFIMAADLHMTWRDNAASSKPVVASAGGAAERRRAEEQERKRNAPQDQNRSNFNRYAPIAPPEVTEAVVVSPTTDKILGKRREGAPYVENNSRNIRRRDGRGPSPTPAINRLRIVTEMPRRSENACDIDNDSGSDSPGSAPASFLDAREEFWEGTPSPSYDHVQVPSPVKKEDTVSSLSLDSSVSTLTVTAVPPPPSYSSQDEDSSSDDEESVTHAEILLEDIQASDPTDKELARTMAQALEDLEATKRSNLSRSSPGTRTPTLGDGPQLPFAVIAPAATRTPPVVVVEEEEEEDEADRFAAELQRQFDEEDRVLREERADLGLGDYEEEPLYVAEPLIARNVAGPSTRTNQVEETFDFDTMSFTSASPPRVHRLAQQFDHEDDELRSERLALAKEYQQQIFTCGVCMDVHPVDDLIVFHPCCHSFCRTCVKTFVTIELESHRFPISCPECIADREKYVEPSVVDYTFLQVVGVSNNEYDIFLEMQMAAFSVQVHCRKCTKTMFIDRAEHDAASILTCPLPDCRHSWCKACQQEVELGGARHSCDGASELNNLIQNQGWRRCPGCKMPVEKTGGCQHMTCGTPGCFTHFCWNCAQLIIKSPIAKDVSGALQAHYRSGCALFVYPDVV